jgi:hypothetical protein
VQFQFDSMRMASEYYKLLYNEQYNIEESYWSSATMMFWKSLYQARL